MAMSAPGQELRIVMIGKNSIDKTSLGNFMSGKQNRLFSKTTQKCVDTQGKWQGNNLTIVKTPNFFSLPVEKVRLEMKKCVALCQPGPNILLLLVKPSDFSEEDRRKLLLYLKFFGEDALKHSLVVIMGTETVAGSSVNQLIRDCGQRQYSNCFDKRGLQELMEKMVKVVSSNQGRHLIFMRDAEPTPALKSSHTPLNLLLCGTDRSEKTSAVGAILDQGRSTPPTDPSSNVLKKGAVCGRQVSLVELPTLHGKAPDTAKEESYRCVSLCDPEGVHALVLVVTLQYIIDEDHRELEAIKSIFGSRVNDITMVLFITESDPNTRVVKFQKQSEDFQVLSQSCGGRHVILNIKDMQQVPELLHAVDTMSALGSRTFTKDMIPEMPVKIFTRQTSLIATQVQPCLRPAEAAYPNPTKDSLRIVLIGKTGCGKSATANCILGRKCFTSRSSPSSVTTLCQKELGEIDGLPVTVVDTPGLFDTKLSHTEIQREVMSCISMLAPGPHVFLLVLSIGRFTTEQKETMKLIKTFFGERAGDFTVLMFTRGDELQGQTLTEYLQEGDETLKELVSEFGGRYLAFNSTNIQNRDQVKELLSMVEDMVTRNGGSYYTSDMFSKAEEAIQKETQKILKSREMTSAFVEGELVRQCKEEIQAKERTVSELTLQFEREEAERMRLVKEREEQIRLQQEKSDRARKEREEEKKQQELKKSREEEGKQKHYAAQMKLSFNKMLQKTTLRKRSRKEEALERQRKDWWERCCQQEEEAQEQEQLQLAKLIEEHEQLMNNYRKKKEEDRVRREEAERELREIQEKYRRMIEDVRRSHEEEARKQAEESNEFRRRYTRDVAAEKEKYECEMQHMKKQQQRHNKGIINHLTRNKAFRKDFDMLKKRQGEEISSLKSTMCFRNMDEMGDAMRALQLEHQEEINDWIEEHVQMATKSGLCTIL